jgi:RNA polymerase sigma-70 factor (ECF subfamily)
VSSGGRDAFERLFDRHRRQLLGAVRLRMRPALRARIDPSDVVQETYVEAIARMPDYLARKPMPFGLWLRKTARERLIKLDEHHRAARRSPRREVPLPARSSLLLAERLVEVAPPASREVSRRETAQRVRQALAQLNDDDREILLMRYLEHLSNQEIAALLDIDPAAASRRHGRALMRLEKTLRQLGLGEVEP